MKTILRFNDAVQVRVNLKLNDLMDDFRIGHGYDVHALISGSELRVGGVSIPHFKSAAAHSDGDVAVHALCDALLGAAALGDIGQHFPDSSAEFKDIDSMVLLERTVEMLGREGYEIGNADITIALQEPKLQPHINSMRTRLSEAMRIGYDKVSVKATTTEHLGFVGREEGVEATAVVLIRSMPENH